MYEFEIEDVSYSTAMDVDSSYVADDLEQDVNATVAAGCGGVAAIIAGAIAIGTIYARTEFMQDINPYHDAFNYVAAAYEDGEGLSQAEADTILAKTRDAMESVNSISDEGIVNGIHEKVMHHASKSYAFTDVERTLLEALKDLNK